MGQVPTLGTPFRRKETTIKGSGKKQKGRGGDPQTHQRHQKKLPGPCRGPILSGKLSPSQLNREEHRDNHCPYT